MCGYFSALKRNKNKKTTGRNFIFPRIHLSPLLREYILVIPVSLIVLLSTELQSQCVTLLRLLILDLLMLWHVVRLLVEEVKLTVNCQNVKKTRRNSLSMILSVFLKSSIWMSEDAFGHTGPC